MKTILVHILRVRISLGYIMSTLVHFLSAMLPPQPLESCRIYHINLYILIFNEINLENFLALKCNGKIE